MIVINSSTRQFNIPGADLVFGVESDSGSVTKEFQCPRYVGNNLDLTGCFIRMNYRNANGEIDSYLVKNVTVDGDNIVFGWELTPKVTMYKGNVSFVMCVVGPDTKVKWHTTLGRGQVLEGLEPDEALIEEGTADVVAALIAMVEAQTEVVESKGAEWVRNVQSEGTDQIVAVQTAAREAQSDAVAQIEAKGVNVRESIPDDYTALSEAVDTLNRTRGAAIVCEAAGETVVVGDSSNLPMQGLRVFGKTTQVKTAGAQLTPYPYFNGNKTYNGITWTINPDGSVKAKGTATATSPLYFTNSTHELAPGQYTVSGSANGVTVRIDSTIRETGKWKAGVAISKNGQPVTFTITEEDAATYFYTLYASVENGNTVDVTIYPMLNAGSSALPWEIYTGGKPSPSPDYPQELVSLEPVVTVAGRNLCSESELDKMGINGTSSTYDSVTRTITMNADPTGFAGRYCAPFKKMVVGKDYTVSFSVRGTPGKIVKCGWDKQGVTITLTDTFTRYSATLKATRTNEPIVFYTRATEYGGLATGEYMQFADVQIEPGSEATAYEPYKALQTLELTHTLPGIPVTSGGNYTDSDGRQWVCDEVDLERGVYVRRVGTATYTGDSSEYVSTYGTKDSGFAVSRKSNDYMLPTGSDVVIPAFCDKLTVASTADIYSLGSNAKFAFSTSGNVIRFSLDTLSGFTVDEVRSWLSENPLTFMYMLATPIETPLSETEIAAYRALHSNYPNTTVLNDAGAHMVVKYAADTKLYIDNKIAALVGG